LATWNGIFSDGTPVAKRILRFQEAGRVSYDAGLALQKELHAQVLAGAPPILLSLEHEPVYTLGRRPAPNRFHSAAPAKIPVVKTDRGGEITYHGPGQAVLYVFLALTRWRLTLPKLVHALEQAIIDTVAAHGIEAQRKCGWRGIFVNEAKLASIGLSVHHDVTMHGLALNVSNDLRPFGAIHPCGLDVDMLSMHALGAPTAERAAVGRELAARLAPRLRATLVEG
jgi:lipoyl(octanoyl) transferase